jgi:hydrogenase maturation protease
MTTHLEEGAGWRSQLGSALDSVTVDLVGVGNQLRGDDGLGIEIVSRLRKRLGTRRGVRAHLPSRLPERVLSKLAEERGRIVIFDAVEASKPPGTIICSLLAETKYGYFATHNVPLRLVPGLGEKLSDVYILGIQPESLEVGDGLSETASRSVDEVVEFVSAWEEEHR